MTITDQFMNPIDYTADNRLAIGNKIRLTRMPGNKVISENMTFRLSDVKKHGGKETVMASVKAAMMNQFKLTEKDVAILEVIEVRKPDTGHFCCLAYLSGNREPDNERDAMSYYAAHRDADTGTPEFIDI